MAVDPALAKSLFLAAFEISDPAERAKFLELKCAGNFELRDRVEALLRVDDTSVQTQLNQRGRATENYQSSMGSLSPIIAGKYKLLQRIGEGGMGTVWMAEQTVPIKRRVAVKLIRTDRNQSKTILTRFEAERQAIALMDHPNIAKLLDAGTAEDGSPYFVMELVKGIPLTEFCDLQKLSIPDRLNLFVKICSAVQHAHQKGIIHRDLKPSNILIESHDGKPVPKVIDFGLAKATNGLQLSENTLFTGFGSVLGTPLYMSPEQANFNAVDVDTRADVFALGVILYELLTGTTPLSRDSIKKAAIDEMLRLIRDEEPPTPSSRLSSSDTKPTIAANRQMEPAKLGNFVKGELDWIVIKALSKERERRYDTASSFAKDIERFLTHEPVQAGPPRATYRLRKFIRRNRLQVVTAAVVLMTLICGITGTSLALFESQRQKGIAIAEIDKKEQARKKTREALDTLTSDALAEWFTREQTLSKTQTEMLQRLLGLYAEFAEEGGSTQEQKIGQVRALVRVGRIQRALGDRTSAESAFRTALNLAGTAESPLTDDIAGLELVWRVNSELAAHHKAESNLRQAELCMREGLAAALKMKGKTVPPHHLSRKYIAASHLNLGAVLSDLHQFNESDIEQEIAAEEFEQLLAEFPLDSDVRENVCAILLNQAMIFAKRGNLEDALTKNKRALDMQRQTATGVPDLQSQHLRLTGLRQQARLLSSAHRPREAVEFWQESISEASSLCKKFPAVVDYRISLGADYSSLSVESTGLGNIEQSAEAVRKGVEVLRQVTIDFPTIVEAITKLVSALTFQAQTLCLSQKPHEAETAAREALRLCEHLLAQKHNPDVVRDLRTSALEMLALSLGNQGKHGEAIVISKERVSELAARLKAHPEVAFNVTELVRGHMTLASSLIDGRDADAAVEELREALRLLDRLQPNERERFQLVNLFELTKVLVISGRWRETEEQAGQAIETAVALRAKYPDYYEYKKILTQLYWHRATARDQLSKSADAATDWKFAAGLADIDMDRAFYLARCGNSFAQSGNAEQAMSELNAAILQVTAVLKGSGLSGQALYDAAVVYALAAKVSKDNPEPYALEAVRLLGKSATLGFLTDPAQLQALREENAFVTLQERVDFKQLFTNQPTKSAM